MNRYAQSLIQGVFFASVYFYIKQDLLNQILFLQFVLFYMLIQDAGRMMDVRQDMIVILFMGRLIAVYLEKCEKMKIDEQN